MAGEGKAFSVLHEDVPGLVGVEHYNCHHHHDRGLYYLLTIAIIFTSARKYEFLFLKLTNFPHDNQSH